MQYFTCKRKWKMHSFSFTRSPWLACHYSLVFLLLRTPSHSPSFKCSTTLRCALSLTNYYVSWDRFPHSAILNNHASRMMHSIHLDLAVSHDLTYSAHVEVCAGPSCSTILVTSYVSLILTFPMRYGPKYFTRNFLPGPK